MNRTKSFIRSLFLLKIYGSFMLVFFLFRLFLFIINVNLWEEENFYTIFESFMIGLRYDNVIVNYIMAIPILLFLISYCAGKHPKWIFQFSKFWIFFLSSICFLISAGDIPFFQYYNSRITITILSWTGTPFLMLKAVFTNFWFVFNLLIGIGVAIAWYKFLTLITQRTINKCSIEEHNPSLILKIAFSLIIPIFIFFSIRGQINLNYMPIGIKNAYYCDNSFLNQGGLNPVFTFVSSFKDDKIELMDLDKAYKIVRNELNIKENESQDINRNIVFDTLPDKKNVILILVESLSAERMSFYGNKSDLTPFLDSLVKKSLFFPNTYSAGIHTYNGVFSSLYALPALLGRNPMTNVSSSNQKFDGLPIQMKNNGYKTLFFCPNNKDFDNLGGFLTSNGFDEIIDESTYPREKIVGGWGVADDFLFENGIKHIHSKNYKQPFFAAFLTVSTHKPYIIPKDVGFKPKSEDINEQIYQYTDWSIKKFIDLASKEPWFSNTIFVVVADHGQNFDPTYEMPLSYHQIPLIFYSPSFIEPKIDNRFALQLDIFPTLMNMLKISYTNTTLGVDLINDKSRPFAFFSADNKIGIVDTTFFYVWQNNGREKLYNYKQKSIKDEFSQQKNRVEVMKNYSFSFIQVCDDLFKQKRNTQIFLK